MGKSTHGGKGDIVGVGARRFILSHYGPPAPYKLGARLTVNDAFVADKMKFEADHGILLEVYVKEPTANTAARCPTCRSCQDIAHDFTMHIGKTKVSSGVGVGQTFVIQPKEVQSSE
jgi:hypothetical protein